MRVSNNEYGLEITTRHAKTDLVFGTIKRFDGFAASMETVGEAIDKLDELSRPYHIQATSSNASLDRVEVFLANESDANLFFSAFEDFEDQ